MEWFVDGELVTQVFLLTGPEVVDVVSDIVVIVFLIFALFALIAFLVMALLTYRRVSTLIDTLTIAAERRDQLLEDLQELTGRVKASQAIPGMAIRGAIGTLSAVLGGIFNRRRQRDSDD